MLLQPAGEQEVAPDVLRNSLIKPLSLPQYLLPGRGVVIRVAPAHLHRAHQGVLPEHVGAEASVHVLTLLQGEAGQAEHEGQDSPCGVAVGGDRERAGESMRAV